MEFEKPDWRARFGQLGYLFKNTFTIVGRNRAIISPIVQMSIYAIAMISLFSVGLLLVLYNNDMSKWLLLAAVIMFFYKFFYYSRTELLLSRMVYEAAIGNEPEPASAREQLTGLGRQARVLGMLDMVSAWIASRKNKQGFFSRMLLGGIVEIWDLVNHFLLPAFAIDKHGLRDGLSELKELRSRIPETLAGVFGIDVMGRVVGSVMAPVYLFLVVAGVVSGLLFGAQMPGAFSAGEIGDLLPNIPEGWPIGPHTIFSWLPVSAVIFVGLIINALFSRLVEAIKVIYFTLFYARIFHADELAPDIRADLEGYLNLEEPPKRRSDPIAV